MRTLKKTLCFVLVLAMMFSFGVTAMAYTDDEAITYGEAVDVLSGLGIIVGYPDGSFGATNVLTRAEAAVMLTRMLGAGSLTGKSNFVDMAGYEWAEPAVAYIANLGIVEGIGDGKFNPGGELTGSAWLKMLAGALGFDAFEYGMTGLNWEVGVATVAKELGLTAGVKADQTAACTRDVACAYAFNALTYAEGEYQFAVMDPVNGDWHFFETELEAAAYAALVGSIVEEGEWVNTLGWNVFGLHAVVGTDSWGVPYTGWAAGKDLIVKYEAAPIATYTTPVNEATVFEALDAVVGHGEYWNTEDVIVVDTTYVNGNKNAEHDYFVDKGSKTVVPHTGNGTTTSYYYSWNGLTCVVKEQYIGEIVNVVSANKVTGADRYVVLDGYCYGSSTAHDYVVYTEAYEKGDIYLYNVCNGVPCNFVAPKTVSGTVTKVVNETVYTIDEAQFVKSAHNACDIFLGDTASWYLDSCGNLIMKAHDIKLTAYIGYLLAYDGQNFWKGDKAHTCESYEASEKYTIYDVEKGIIELDGACFTDKAGNTYLTAIGGYVAFADGPAAADKYDIALGKGHFDGAGLSTGLVVYYLDENNDIYWISDEGSIDGSIVIYVDDEIAIEKNNVYFNGLMNNDDTAYFYAGLKVQEVTGTAVGYANAIKADKLVAPGEVAFNVFTGAIVAVSQHADPAAAQPVPGTVYVGRNFSETVIRTATYDKLTHTYEYEISYVYTGLYLDGAEMATFTTSEPLVVAKGALYNAAVLGTKVTIDVSAPIEPTIAEIAYIGEGYIVLADGTDIHFAKDVLVIEMKNGVVSIVEGIPALSVKYDVGVYYFNAEANCSVIYIWVD